MKTKIHFFRFACILFSVMGFFLSNVGIAAYGEDDVAPGVEPWPVEGQTWSKSGLFTIVWGDSREGADQMVYFLTDEGGQKTVLALDEKLAQPMGGVLALNGKRVTIQGIWAAPLAGQSMPTVMKVISISLAAPLSGAEIEEGGVLGAVVGSKPWVTIMCKFSDFAVEPKNLAYFQGMYANSYPGLDHFWRELSYNTANVAGSNAYGWFVLPHTEAYYNPTNTAGGADLNKLVADCTAAANPTVNFSGYVGINMMFNTDFDNGWAWGGSAFLSLDGVTKTWSVTWEPPWAYEDISVIQHEMGHGFGLPHSSGNYGATYDNAWDVMSKDRYNCAAATHATYGCVAQHTISYHKDKLGWIAAGDKFTLNLGSKAAVVLERLALPTDTTSDNNLKMVQIPIGGSATHFYTVEVRRRNGYDTKLAGNAVIIHEVDTTRTRPAYVIDTDGNGVTSDAGAMFVVGETFSDATNKISVHVESESATGFSVIIANQPREIYDFNGDFKADILWRNAVTGQNIIWLMDGLTRVSTNLIPTVTDLNYKIAGQGDFNGDGKSDILWRHATNGQNVIWFMNGTTRTSGPAIPTVTDLNYKIAGVGDFNKDGKSDILWRHATSGQNVIWFMNGATRTSGPAIPTVADLNYKIVGVGDFDGDGKSDILWHHATSGNTVIWFMNGATRTSGPLVWSAPDVNWQIVGVGDFNGDRMSDIFWRHAVTGSIGILFMVGETPYPLYLGDLPDLNWKVAEVRDFDGDGRADILWRHAVSGENCIWLASLVIGWPGTVVDLNWKIIP